MAKKKGGRRAWHKPLGMRSLRQPNTNALAAYNDRVRGASPAAHRERFRREQHEDKVLRDTFGIGINSKYWKAQPKTEKPGTEEYDRKLAVLLRVDQLQAELADPAFEFFSLSTRGNIRAAVKYRHGTNAFAHEYYVVEYNLKTRNLRESFQISSSVRAIELWQQDRIQWQLNLFLPDLPEVTD